MWGEKKKGFGARALGPVVGYSGTLSLYFWLKLLMAIAHFDWKRLVLERHPNFSLMGFPLLMGPLTTRY